MDSWILHALLVAGLVIHGSNAYALPDIQENTEDIDDRLYKFFEVGDNSGDNSESPDTTSVTSLEATPPKHSPTPNLSPGGKSNAEDISGDGEGYSGNGMEKYNMAGLGIQTFNATDTTGNYGEVNGDGETEHSKLFHGEVRTESTDTTSVTSKVTNVTTTTNMTNLSSVLNVTTPTIMTNLTSVLNVTTTTSMTNLTSVLNVTTATSITNLSSVLNMTTASSITNLSSVLNVTTATIMTNLSSVLNVTTATIMTNLSSVLNVTTPTIMTNLSSVLNVTTASSITNLTSVLTTNFKATPPKHSPTPNLSPGGRSHTGWLLLALGIMVLLCTVVLVSTHMFACQVRNLRDQLCSFCPAHPPRVNADVIRAGKPSEVMETEMEKMMEEAKNTAEKTLRVDADVWETEAAIIPTAPPADPSSDCVLNV